MKDVEPIEFSGSWEEFHLDKEKEIGNAVTNKKGYVGRA